MAGWSDDQIARAIREGVKHDDTILFPHDAVCELQGSFG